MFGNYPGIAVLQGGEDVKLIQYHKWLLLHQLLTKYMK